MSQPQHAVPPAEHHHAQHPAWVRPTLWAAGGFLVVLVLLYGGLFWSVGPAVPRGAKVAGVVVGGLTVNDATARLVDEVDDTTLAVSVDGQVTTLPASRVGLTFNPEASVSAAGQRSWNPLTLVRQWLPHEVPPVITVDDSALDRAVRRLARGVDQAARQGGVSYDGLDVVAVTPRAGLVLDRPGAKAAIVAAYPQREGEVELPLRTLDPAVSAEEVRRVADGIARSAVAAPVVLRVAGQQVDVPPELIAATLRFVPHDGTLVPRVDGRAVHDALSESLSALETPAKDASFSVASGKPVVVAAHPGAGVGDDELARGIRAVLGRPAGERLVPLRLVSVKPSLTTRQARKLGITRVVSSYTQYFPYAAYRVTNIGLAAKKINGTILRPGDTFSMNGIVGERTPENGFVKGYIIGAGNELVEDYGGAVSTITTATWHAAFYAGMTRIEQRAHGFWISRYTPGLEATVSWGSLDLKFRNDTPHGVLVTAGTTSDSVTITMWSTKYWDIAAEFGPRTNVTPFSTVYNTSPNCVAQGGVDGFDITVTRVWSRGGEVKRQEPLTTSYDPAPTVICGSRPQPSPKPSPSGTKPKPSPTSSGSPQPKPSGSG